MNEKDKNNDLELLYVGKIYWGRVYWQSGTKLGGNLDFEEAAEG